MWNFKNITVSLFICCVAGVLAENCDPNYILPNWEISDSAPPAYLRLGQVQEVAAGLEAQVERIQENFSLTLFANPFIMDGNCPPANSSYHNLRRFHKPYDVIKDGDVNKSLFFSKIFTGCYYVEMRNTEGKRWLWNPVFYHTSYHYYDTMLTCKKFEVESKNNNVQLTIELEIPLTCLQVQVRLFELPRITLKFIGDWTSGNTRVLQDCWVKNIGDKQPLLIRCSNPDKDVTLSATLVDENDRSEGWSTVITWDFLNKDDISHYASFQLYNGACNTDYSDLMTWKPVVNFGSVFAGSLNKTNRDKYAYNSLAYS